jgi:hypothetical protein
MAKFHPGASLPQREGETADRSRISIDKAPDSGMKPMRDTLLDVRRRLIGGAYDTPVQIQVSIVARILNGLDWDVWNPSEVNPLYDTGSIGFALNAALGGDPHGPSVVIDVQSANDIAKLSNTFANDARHGRSPALLVITDGRKWQFYCSTTDHSSPLQRFKIADLTTDPIDGLISTFRTFLAKPAVQSGKASHDALDVLGWTKRLQAIKRVLPDAQKLALKPPYPTLPQALVQCLHSIGHTISVDEVVPLIELVDLPAPSRTKTPHAVPLTPSPVRTNNPTTPSTLPPDGTQCRFHYKGQTYRGEIKRRRLEVLGHGEFDTFSGASTELTHTNRNGWRDWECQLPGTNKWIIADTLRGKE